MDAMATVVPAARAGNDIRDIWNDSKKLKTMRRDGARAMSADP
jgi:hypothetical protein